MRHQFFWRNTHFMDNINLPLDKVSRSVLKDRLVTYTEWWNPDLKDCIVYFSSWDDLKTIGDNKLRTIDNNKPRTIDNNYNIVRSNAKSYAKNIRFKTILEWKEIFNSLIANI